MFGRLEWKARHYAYIPLSIPQKFPILYVSLALGYPGMKPAQQFLGRFHVYPAQPKLDSETPQFISVDVLKPKLLRE